MCGIAGVVGKQAPDELEKMLDKLAHRGPDGHGMKYLPNRILGQTRPAIIDFAGGHHVAHLFTSTMSSR